MQLIRNEFQTCMWLTTDHHGITQFQNFAQNLSYKIEVAKVWKHNKANDMK